MLEWQVPQRRALYGEKTGFVEIPKVEAGVTYSLLLRAWLELVSSFRLSCRLSCQ